MQQRNKISILSTRPIDEALVATAASKGFFVDIHSFITTEPIQSIEVLQEIEQVLILSATVVFTSMNAVEAVAFEMIEIKPDWRIYCIGHTTSKLVEKYFGSDSIAGTADNATKLAELIIKTGDTDEVYFFCGDKHRDELPQTLRGNDIQVNEIIVYQTIMIPHKMDKEYDGILFFSPTAVESFFLKNKINESTVLFAIGETTAAEIKKYSTNKLLISDEPGKKNLFDKAISYFENNPTQRLSGHH